MTTLNKSARDVMIKYDVHACTDVTGFGLMGHLLEMVQGSDVNAVIETKNINLLAEAYAMAKMGVLPEGLYRNRSFAECSVDGGNVELAVQDMLYDPQTSGGLLMAVSQNDADKLFEELKTCVPSAQKIGYITEITGETRIKLI
ncbi:Selenide, water dikinase [bioreactor metagenome]|uniref:Selenide, water dikinase n=1 Tax=bioreactor metagenome TaxID=1076179 RepID=A0A645EQE8_9ZZZZ